MAEEVKEAKVCDFGKFQFKRVLNDDAHSKSTFIEGNFGGDEPAVVILEKTPFSEENSSKVLRVSHEDSTETFRNDIYSGYKLHAKTICNDIKVTVIYPATEKHIEKYSRQEMRFVQETPAIYEEKVKPYLIANCFSVQWVYNILEHKKEQESVLFEDPDEKTGFMVCKDMKWDMKQTIDLHLLTIVHDRSLRSIRDLRAEHLPLLQNIRTKTAALIEDKFGLSKDKIMMYFHYQPSYYHLHVHAVALSFDQPPGGGCQKGHLIDVVISNLEISDDYYKKATLCYTLKETDPLTKAIYGDAVSEKNKEAAS